jgi:hypothetical protein
MFGFRKLLANSRRSARPARSNHGSFRPGVEGLEDRQLMSATSAWMPLFPNGRPLFFGIGKYTGQVEFGGTTSNGWVHTIPGSPNNITDVSAGVARDGNYDVFARDYYGGVWEWGTDTGGAWRSLWGKYLWIAAGNHGEVFAIGTDYNVYENSASTPSGWVKLSGLRAYGGLSVGMDANTGTDYVFAIAEDRLSIAVHSANPADSWQTTVRDTGYDFSMISATRHNQVWATSRGSLFEIMPSMVNGRVKWSATNWGKDPWGTLGIKGLATGTDALGHDVTYVLDTGGIVSEVETTPGYGVHGWHYASDGSAEVAGGVNGYYYTVSQSDSRPRAHLPPANPNYDSSLLLKPSDPKGDPWSAWAL